MVESWGTQSVGNIGASPDPFGWAARYNTVSARKAATSACVSRTRLKSLRVSFDCGSWPKPCLASKNLFGSSCWQRNGAGDGTPHALDVDAQRRKGSCSCSCSCSCPSSALFGWVEVEWTRTRTSVCVHIPPWRRNSPYSHECYMASCRVVLV